MNRERYEELMDGWARGVLPEGEANEFEAAIAANAEWRAEAEDHRRLARVMAAAPKVKAPEGLLAAALKSARSADVKNTSANVVDIGSESVTKKKGGRRWYMSMAAAAAFAIVGVSAYQLSGTSKTQSRGSVRSEMGDRTKEGIAVADAGSTTSAAPKKTSALGSIGSTQRIIPNGLVSGSGKSKDRDQKPVVGGDQINGAMPAAAEPQAAAAPAVAPAEAVSSFSEADMRSQVAQSTGEERFGAEGATAPSSTDKRNEDLNEDAPIVVADLAKAPPVSSAVKEESALPTPGAASALDLMAMDIAVDGMGREAATSSDETEFESDQFRVHMPDHDGGNTLTIRPNAPATMPNRKVDAQSPKLKTGAKNEPAKAIQEKQTVRQDADIRVAGTQPRDAEESKQELAFYNQPTASDDVMNTGNLVTITQDESEYLLAQANSAGGRPWFAESAGTGGANVNGFALNSTTNPSGNASLGQDRQMNMVTRSMVPNGQSAAPAPGATQHRNEVTNTSLVQFEFPDQQSLDVFYRNLRYDSRIDSKQTILLQQSAAQYSYNMGKAAAQSGTTQPTPIAGPPTPPGLADKRQVRRARPFDADAYTSEVIRTADGRLVLRLQKRKK